MATRRILTDLAADFERRTGIETVFESVGGVDAARRVQAGERFDLVVLASDAVARLVAAGCVSTENVTDLVRSPMAIAVREAADSKTPDVRTEEALRDAVLAAPSIGYSTGPSGTALLELFERWGIAQEVRPRLVQASPGVPVGRLVAEGQAALGFQQLSELIHQPGIRVIGQMPPGCEVVTTFTGGVCTVSSQPEAARRLLAFLASPATGDVKRQHGMESA